MQTTHLDIIIIIIIPQVMGEEVLVRVRFSSRYAGTIRDLLNNMTSQEQDKFHDVTQKMSDVMWEVEECGAAPVLPDGKVGGNCAVKIIVAGKEHLVVSKSGKLPGRHMDAMSDVCVVQDFNPTTWQATYRAESEDVLPTSDTPLHYATLQAGVQLGWNPLPTVLVHGHGLQTAEQAAELHLPCSMEETMCSTPADSQAMEHLLQEYAYPEHKVYIRRGHGFILLAQDLTEAATTFRQTIKPYM